MKAGQIEIRSLAASQLLFFFSFLLLIVLPGCGGENSQHVRTDSAKEYEISATAAPASTTVSAPANGGRAHAPVVDGRTISADSAGPARNETAKKKDSAAATTATAAGNAKTEEAKAPKPVEGSAAAGGACPEVTPELITEGRTVFIGRGNCVSCHGADGKGNALGPDLTDGTWLHISGDYPSVVEIVRKGVNLVIEHPTPMPPMGGSKLTDEQICAVGAYVWSLSHP